MKSFLGNFYRHLAIFFWSHCSRKAIMSLHRFYLSTFCNYLQTYCYCTRDIYRIIFVIANKPFHSGTAFCWIFLNHLSHKHFIQIPFGKTYALESIKLLWLQSCNLQSWSIWKIGHLRFLYFQGIHLPLFPWILHQQNVPMFG